MKQSETNKPLIIDHHNKLKLLPEHKGKILIYETGKMSQVFNEDALILNRLFDYKVSVLGQLSTDEGINGQYLKVSFPTSRLKAITKKIKETIQINFIHFKRKNQEIFSTFYYSSFKQVGKKQEFLKADDVHHFINNFNDNKESQRDYTVNQIKRGARKDYQLHRKIVDFASFLPRAFINSKYKIFYQELFIKNYNDILLLVNKTRNKYSQNQKNIFYLEISSLIDTLKDLSDILYKTKGFKNQKQHNLIYVSLSEIGRINSGLVKKNV